MEKKPDLLQGIENRADWILKRFELQADLADYNKRMLREYMVFQFTEYITEIAKQFQSQLSEAEKRHKIELSNYAYQIDSAKRERDKAESQNERLLSALKDVCNSNRSDLESNIEEAQQLINEIEKQ